MKAKYRLVKTDKSSVYGAFYQIDDITDPAWITVCDGAYWPDDVQAQAWFDAFCNRKATGESSITILEEREV